MEDVLQPEPEQPSTPKLSPLVTRFDRNIEKWLKYGGIIYLFIGVFFDITNFIFKVFLADRRILFSQFNLGDIVFNAIQFVNSILLSILWGLFYFGLGKIIEILRKGFQHEE